VTLEEGLLESLRPNGSMVDIYGSSVAIMERIVEVVKAARAYRNNDSAADDLELYTLLDKALARLDGES
jgi:hypothetical protein